MFKLIICLIILLAATPVMAKPTNTIVQRPKPTKHDPLSILPGHQIPLIPEAYTFKTTTKFHGKDHGFENIPVYNISDGRRSKVGEIPSGKEIKLEEFAKIGTSIYYSMPFSYNAKAANAKNQKAWVSGAHIEATAYQPTE